MSAPDAPAYRVAIVSDPLVQRGGAERVVIEMTHAFPEAPVFAVLFSERNGPSALAPRVRQSWLGRIPRAAERHRAFLPFYPSAVEGFDLSAFDVILSSHHTVAKGVLRRADQVHVCYCHTPMRALWERAHEEARTVPGIARPAVHAMFSRLRVWDYVTAARVDRFLANSRTTQQRIRSHYGRESDLLHPPIDTERFTPGGTAGDYYLIASRPVAYKRIDIAIAAARRLHRRVVVVGGAKAGMRSADGIEVLGHVDDARLVELMRGARALLFPQLEDFGMTPLEMNACGRPVIAYGAGGALETVIDGVTGVHARAQTVESFADAMLRFEATAFDPVAIRTHAEAFGRARFVASLRAIVDDDVRARRSHALGASGEAVAGAR